MGDTDLPGELDRLVREARTATLATIRTDGRPRLVPICYVVAPRPVRAGSIVHTPLDEKPKRTGDPHRLARVRDIAGRPEVELLVERWDEDWHRLAWVRLDGIASLIEPGERGAERDAAIAGLRAKYPQYAAQALERRPLVRIAVERVAWWAGSPS